MTAGAPGLKSRCYDSIARLAAIAWVVLSIGLFLVADRQSTAMLDRALRETAMTILAFSAHELAEIRTAGGPRLDIGPDDERDRELVYQVLNADGTLAYRSAAAPTRVFAADVPGFSTLAIDGVGHRTFTAWNPQRTFQIRIGTPYYRRDAHVLSLSAGLSLALLVTFAILLFLVRRQLDRSFSPLESTARLLAEKTPADLSAIASPRELPEIAPMIEAFNKLMSRVDRSHRQERRFADDAAHALRTPLSSLRLLVGNLRVAGDGPARSEALGLMDTVIQRSSEVVDQLLRLARFDCEPSAVDLSERVELAELAKAVIEDCAPMAAERKLLVRAAGAPGSVWVSGNRAMLAVALRSIVENALSFAPEYGTVLVEVVHDRAAAAAMVRVHDDGPGVERDLQDRVFSLFFKVDRSDSTHPGLGLPLVARIAQIHGGLAYLGVSAMLGGAMAVVRLPCPSAPADSPPPADTGHAVASRCP
jgi:signal transduction histidine kinase